MSFCHLFFCSQSQNLGKNKVGIKSFFHFVQGHLHFRKKTDVKLLSGILTHVESLLKKKKRVKTVYLIISLSIIHIT